MGTGQARLSATHLAIAACSSIDVTIRYSNALKAERKSFSTVYRSVSLEGMKIAKSKEHM